MARRGRWQILADPISATDGGEKRLAKLAAAMADAPKESLPKQCCRCGDLKAAYLEKGVRTLFRPNTGSNRKKPQKNPKK